MPPIISVQNLSKVYNLGHSRGYRTLRESLSGSIGGAWMKLRRRGRSTVRGDGENKQFTALDDVSFDIQAGQVVGIVGRNGAGKSTLLKLLSQIVEPSQGMITVRGRIGSLLEVGTGFHPELTGRENIYLNGAILGMTRKEIARKFDEIVDFAEIETFLDVPVKRYSSGMYVRLAFAVASHLEPEVLVIDEVLAVGDAAFQKKCMGKMSDASMGGRTVIFVSHNMSAVKSLCDRAILIDRGKLMADGRVDDIVNSYMNTEGSCESNGLIPEDADRHSDVRDEARIRSIRLVDPRGKNASKLFYGQPFRVIFTCEIFKRLQDCHFEISISTLDGTHVVYSRTEGSCEVKTLSVGCHTIHADFDVNLLPGSYALDLGIHHEDGTTADFVPHVLTFIVLRVAESGDDHYRWNSVRGFVRVRPTWNCESPSSPCLTPLDALDHARLAASTPVRELPR